MIPAMVQIEYRADKLFYRHRYPAAAMVRAITISDPSVLCIDHRKRTLSRQRALLPNRENFPQYGTERQTEMLFHHSKMRSFGAELKTEEQIIPLHTYSTSFRGV